MEELTWLVEKKQHIGYAQTQLHFEEEKNIAGSLSQYLLQKMCNDDKLLL